MLVPNNKANLPNGSTTDFSHERYWTTGSPIIWPEEREKRLRELIKEDLSASDIGYKLGVTRSAVIGKLGRLGLKLANFKGNKVKRSHTRKPRPIAIGEPSTPRFHYTQRHRLRINLIETEPHLTPSDFDNAIPQEQRKTLLQLNGHTCHWPVGDVGEPGFFFCGGWTESTYCDHHTMRAMRS